MQIRYTAGMQLGGLVRFSLVCATCVWLGAACSSEVDIPKITPPPNQKLDQVTNNTSLAVVDATPIVVNTVAVDPAAQTRDTDRMALVTQIRGALKAYKVKNAAFPDKLELLLDGFLTTTPKDPDGSDFSYTPIGVLPAQFYDLCYSLEVGVDGVEAGYHCATPDGVAQP